jgi:hypothetical protein
VFRHVGIDAALAAKEDYFTQADDLIQALKMSMMMGKTEASMMGAYVISNSTREEKDECHLNYYFNSIILIAALSFISKITF